MVWLRSASGVLAALTVLAHIFALAVIGHVEAVIGGGFIPLRIAEPDASGFPLPVWLTPLSATLVHGDWAHLLLNMLLLVFMGRILEAATGPGRMLATYVAGAFAAAAAQWAWDPSSINPMVGASGAISALIGAYAAGFGQPKPVTQDPRANRAIHVLWLLAAWIVLQLMFDLLAAGEGVAVATPAHIGGFVAGLFATPWLLAGRQNDIQNDKGPADPARPWS